MMGRIFERLGGKGNNVGWLFILGGLGGLIIQGLIGYYWDGRWRRFGRGMRYLLIAGGIGVIRVVLLRN